jgi:hypothetical protein
MKTRISLIVDVRFLQNYVMLLQMFITFPLDSFCTLNSLRTQNVTSPTFCLADELEYGINRS